MTLSSMHSVYFIGIGGIGMSALARYFKYTGKKVSGYDRTSSQLTNSLQNEGINICFEDKIELIPNDIINSNPDNVLFVYTPAIPGDHKQYNYIKEKGFEILKRSQVLGLLSKNQRGIAVAGTHGKTTVSTQIAHILKNSGLDCNAFLGGISNNYNTNFLYSEKSNLLVLEADEYDRSFLQLFPDIAVVTSVDPDHLDIYGDYDTLKENFKKFISQVNKNGKLIIRKGIPLELDNIDIEKYTYALDEEADFYAINVRLQNYKYIIDLVTPNGQVNNLEIGFPETGVCLQ